MNYRDKLLEFQKSYLDRLFTTCNGNVAEAARRSGINRTHLYKMAARVGYTIKPALSMHRDVTPIQVVRQEGNAEWNALGG